MFRQAQRDKPVWAFVILSLAKNAPIFLNQLRMPVVQVED